MSAPCNRFCASQAGSDGRPCFGGRKINLSAVFAGQNVGVREVADHVWPISFLHYDVGFCDDECSRVECGPNPFGAKALPMCPERTQNKTDATSACT